MKRGCMGEYDDERPDWREIDRQRDRSKIFGKQEKGGPSKDKPKDRYKTGKWEKALDKLFMGKKGTAEYKKAFNKIHQSYGTNRFVGNVTRFIEEYGLPDDVSTLLLIIDTKDKNIVIPVLERLKDMYDGLATRQKEDVKRKLSILKLTDKMSEIKKKSEEVLNKLIIDS
jgi:hypothetical protein